MDVDLSQFDINQCGFSNEEEKESEQAFANPLYYFRDTHKCDRINFPPTSKVGFYNSIRTSLAFWIKPF